MSTKLSTDSVTAEQRDAFRKCRAVAYADWRDIDNAPATAAPPEELRKRIGPESLVMKLANQFREAMPVAEHDQRHNPDAALEAIRKARGQGPKDLIKMFAR